MQLRKIFNLFMTFILLFVIVLIANSCAPLPMKNVGEKGSIHWKIPALPFMNSTDNNSETDPFITTDGPITSMEISRNHKYMAITKIKEFLNAPDPNTGMRLNRQVELWNIDHNKPHQEAESELSGLDWAMGATFDTEGEKLYLSDWSVQRSIDSKGTGGANIRRFDLETKMHYLSLLPATTKNNHLRLFKGNHWFACRDEKNVWRLVDSQESKRILYFPKVKIKRNDKEVETEVTEVLAVSYNGDLAATLISDGDIMNEDGFFYNSNETENPRTIVIWDLVAAKSVPIEKAVDRLEALEISQFKVKDGVEPRKCTFSPDSSMIAVRSKAKYVGIWQTANGKLISELGEHKQKIRCMDFSPNNLRLAVGTGGEYGRIIIWDLRKEKIHRVYQESEKVCHEITAITYDFDEPYLYYANEFGDVKIWNIKPKKKSL